MKVAILGSYGEGNLGDEAICSSIIRDINEINKDSKIVLFSHDLEDSSKRYNKENISIRPMIATGFRSFLKQFKNGDFKENIKELKECDLVIIGGGGLFYDSEVSIGINPIFVWFIRVLLFKLLRLKIVLYGVGVGPLNKKISKIFLRILCNLTNNITVRDKYSYNMLKACKVYVPIVISADPVWLTNWEIRDSQEIVKNRKLKYDAKNKLGIQVRISKGLDEVKFIETLVEFIDIMIDKYLFSVVLIPMSFEDPDDRILLEKIQLKSKNENNIELIQLDTENDVTEIMQECDFLVLSRLHSIIMATSLGVPYLALSYSPKTDDLIFKLKLNEFSWPITEIDSRTLERLYINLMKQKISRRKYLLEKSKELKILAKKNLDLFNSIKKK
jgi:polysaccharide pyruvyl transferase CsaB